MIIVQELHKCDQCGHMAAINSYLIKRPDGWTTGKGELYLCPDCTTKKPNKKRFSMVIQCSICKEEHILRQPREDANKIEWISHHMDSINFFDKHYKCNEDLRYPSIILK